MFSYLLLLLLCMMRTGLSQDPFLPSGTPPPPTAELEFTFDLPRICVDCCMDLIFVLDRTSSAAGPKNSERIHWDRMRNIISQLSADPLNRVKVRTGAMQMGSPTISSSADLAKADAGTAASGTTGIRFELKRGPFPKTIDTWGNNNIFSSDAQGAWKTVAQVAFDHFTKAPKPWVEEPVLEKRCDPSNLSRLMIWIVANGPKQSQDPCLAAGLMEKLIEAGIQQHIIGVGPAWTTQVMEARKCMFSKGANTKNKLFDVPEWASLKPTGDQCKVTPVPPLFNVDPCNKCPGFVDFVFVLDESGSLCDAHNSAELSGICKDRQEFDREVQLVAEMVAELGKNWKNHRVAIWTFGTKMINHVKLGHTGGKSAKLYANKKRTYAKEVPLTEPQVQDILQDIKAKFQEGYTATALAMNQALGEIEFAPPRADGNDAKKVLMFLTDGGPNPPYYTVDENGARTMCSAQGSANGHCLHWQKFWDGTTEAAQKGQMNMAVCTDAGDPDPRWVRWRAKASGGHERFIEAVKTYADAAPTLDLTLLMLMVGKRAKEHVKDIECLVSKTKKGGLLTAESFEKILQRPAFQSALLNSACTDAPLGASRGVMAEWTEYEAWQMQQLMTKFQQVSMKEQTTSSYVWSGALFIGVGVAALIYGNKSRAEYYTPLLSDELIDTERV